MQPAPTLTPSRTLHLPTGMTLVMSCRPPREPDRLADANRPIYEDVAEELLRAEDS